MSKKSILGFPRGKTLPHPYLIFLFNDKNTEVKVLQSNRTNRKRLMYRNKFIMRDWFT